MKDSHRTMMPCFKDEWIEIKRCYDKMKKLADEWQESFPSLRVNLREPLLKKWKGSLANTVAEVEGKFQLIYSNKTKMEKENKVKNK